MHVHKPQPNPNGKWVVSITESRSPLSETKECHEYMSREAAWQAYRQIMKELGRGL